MKPVGVVHSTRTKTEDDNWDREQVFIQLDSEQFSADALEGLQDFSHVEVLFYMNQVDPAKIEKSARHPRNNLAWPKVGIFAQRGKNRPNQIGTTICRILKVEGLELYLEGLDAIDGSPVLDIKPWVKEFEPRGSVFQPAWISELMTKYWKALPLRAKSHASWVHCWFCLHCWPPFRRSASRRRDTPPQHAPAHRTIHDAPARHPWMNAANQSQFARVTSLPGWTPITLRM